MVTLPLPLMTFTRLVALLLKAYPFKDKVLPAPLTVVVWTAFEVFVIVPIARAVFVPLSVMVRLPALVTAPSPKSRLLSAVPPAVPKAKLAPMVTGLLLTKVMAAPLVLLIVPPLMVKVLAAAPSAVMLLMLS